MSLTAMLSAAVLGLSGGQQEPPPPRDPAVQETQDPTNLGTIVVEGTLQQQARAFVRDVGAPPRYRRQARWDRKICIGVVNMAPDRAQFMIDRISGMALDLGLDIGEPGCRPQIVIVATRDSAGLAQQLVDNYERTLRPVRGVSDRGPRALTAFKNTTAPVRWWHISLPVDVDTGALALGVVQVRNASRIRANTREQMAYSLVIIDVDRVGVASFGALSDYIGMVALSQVDPDVDYAPYDTILNLFGSDSRPVTLSTWDRDYLAALYYVPGDSVRHTQDTRQVARELARRQVGDRRDPPTD